MKKKLLPLAMLAGLAGAVGTNGMASNAVTVFVNPYLTTVPGHVLNERNKAKARRNKNQDRMARRRARPW